MMIASLVRVIEFGVISGGIVAELRGVWVEVASIVVDEAVNVGEGAAVPVGFFVLTGSVGSACAWSAREVSVA
jgi:hypothetical protein